MLRLPCPSSATTTVSLYLLASYVIPGVVPVVSVTIYSNLPDFVNVNLPKSISATDCPFTLAPSISTSFLSGIAPSGPVIVNLKLSVSLNDLPVIVFDIGKPNSVWLISKGLTL